MSLFSFPHEAWSQFWTFCYPSFFIESGKLRGNPDTFYYSYRKCMKMNSLNFNNGKVKIPLSSSYIRIVKILKILCKPWKRKGQPNNNFHISPSTIQFSTANTSQAWQLIHVVTIPGRASRAETLWIRGYPGHLVRFCPKYNTNSNNFKRKETEPGYSSNFCKPIGITVLNPGSPFGSSR